MNVLQIVQAACYASNITSIPTTLVGPTNSSDLQLLNLFYMLGHGLLDERYWPFLKRKHTFQLKNNQQTYQLPQDFYMYLPSTGWDVNNRWEMIGPMTDREWDYRLYGWITTENRTAYRVFGPDKNPNSNGGQFFVNPTPGTSQSGRFVAYEYITKSWLQPPNWIPGTTYTSSPAQYVNCNGQNYKCTTGGTAASTLGPNMSNGQGRDGGVVWQYITAAAWQASTYYEFDEYVTNGGNLYRCTASGKSAGAGGPTGTAATSVTDNTCTWLYCATPAWVGETQYTSGTYVLSDTNKYYLCTTLSNYQQSTNVSQTSGKIAPTWTNTTVKDGTVVWTWLDTPYEAILSDTDNCLYEDHLMIQGLRWMFRQARSLDYQDIKAEWEKSKDAEIARYQSGRRMSLADTDVMLAGLHPRIPEGNFG